MADQPLDGANGSGDCAKFKAIALQFHTRINDLLWLHLALVPLQPTAQATLGS
jgi:hypothetical protein